jgi:hypothetical protein
MKPLRPSIFAGATAALAGAVWLPFVYVHLFTSTPSNTTPWQSAFDQLAFDLSAESPSALLMAVWYALPLAWFGLAALFFVALRFTYSAALVFVGLALALAVASSAMFGWSTAFLFGSPVLLGVAHARRVKPSMPNARLSPRIRDDA